MHTTEQSATTTSPTWVLAVACLVAMVVGTVHVAVLTVRLSWSHTFIWHTREYPWMVPAAYLVAFVAMAVPIVVLRRFTRRTWVAFLYVFLGALSILLLVPRLAPWSQVLLAVGIGVRVGAIVRHASTHRLSRIALGLGLTLGVIAVVDGVARRAGGVRAMASLPVPAANAPNVLLIILDTVRAASLSLHGYERQTTPALIRWAAESVVFDHAMSTSSWTLPSHASLFTGRDARELSTTWRVPLDAQFPTLAEILRKDGYVTAAFVANTYYTGYDSGLNRGFLRYEDYSTSLGQLSWSTTLSQTNLARDLRRCRSVGDVVRTIFRFDLSLPVLLTATSKSASRVTDQFLAWQSSAPDRPFFVFLNYFDAHASGYQPLPRYHELLGVGSSGRDRYDAAIRYLDDEIDRLLSTLRDRDVLDRTIVVVTSDHGEQFGEHGLTGHGNSLYLPVVHVPLLVRYPARLPGARRVSEPVSLRDVPATILGLAGFGGMPGRSLLDSSGSPNPVESFLTSYDDGWLPRDRQRTMRSAILDDLHWIRSFDGSEAVFAYQSDPAEMMNLMADSSVVARFRAIRR